MNLNWDTRINLREHDVLLHEKAGDTLPRVTIGMPTYRRGHLIRRALASIAKQSYRDFVLVISDNAGQNVDTMAAVREFADAIPEVILVAQKANIGALENLKFVLATAETEYFMWLADDDEISSNYLEELIGLLDDDTAAVTAVGRWMHMTAPEIGSIRPQFQLKGANSLNRLFQFVAGNADDSAFYGLHRTSCLRNCNFKGYLPPNRNVLTNWCYLHLFDMLFQGHFAYSNSATWICHNYSEKDYARALARGVSDRVKTLLRRLNVYAVYLGKTARKSPVLVPVILVASLVGLSRDILTAAWRFTSRVLNNRHTRRVS